MRKGILVLCSIWLGLFVYVGSANASCAKCRLQAAWGLATVPESDFDGARVERYEGQVLSVQRVEKDRDVIPGVYVLLKTEEGNRAVRLGPDWYLEREGLAIEPYDKMEVLASEVQTTQSRPALVAAKVRANGKTVVLRSNQGKPVW